MCIRKLQCSGHWITEVLVLNLWPVRVALYLGPRVFRSAYSRCWGPNHREISESSSEYYNTSHWTPSQRNKAGVVLTENESTKGTCLHFFCQLNTFIVRDKKGTVGKIEILFVTGCWSKCVQNTEWGACNWQEVSWFVHGPRSNSGDSTSIYFLNIPLQGLTFVHLTSVISNGTEKHQTKPFMGRNKGLFGNQPAKAISQAGREAKSKMAEKDADFMTAG